ncbi:helix-hairpin-helix domain-containing protein [Robbsia sp. KACC 23696]|uniref:ComEA family DNA-binding protein n=1 Tax=Robbsia sp. KACC 23696 TaxID=3149231 RepID=UPI00325A475B
MLKKLLAAAVLFVSTASMAWAVNMNTANAEDIAQSVNGVGPILARAIVAEREKQPFANANDMGRVRGIGQKLIDRIAQSGATFD